MMKSINALIKRLNAVTGKNYYVTKWGRGDWSLYLEGKHDSELVVNTLGVVSMIEVIKAMMAREVRRILRYA